MKEEDHLRTLGDIKKLMERSTRFLSLSGFSGIFIGLYALAGVAAASWYVGTGILDPIVYFLIASKVDFNSPLLLFLAADAALVLVLSITTAYVFTRGRARKQGLNTWD